MAIGSAIERGSFIFVYDERGTTLFSKARPCVIASSGRCRANARQRPQDGRKPTLDREV